MTEPAPEAELFPWLPAADVLRWLQLDDGSPNAADAELCRQAAADYCEQQRADLVVDVEVDGVVTPTFVASPRIVQAGVLLAGRLFARRSSPAGLASYAELGAADVMRADPDVARLLGVGRHAHPVIG